ncbi:hypothetical protein PO909_023367 [Leuciscus waleckii]
MGVLAMMPALLSVQNSCTPKVANIIAEVAKNGKCYYISRCSSWITDTLWCGCSVVTQKISLNDVIVEMY